MEAKGEKSLGTGKELEKKKAVAFSGCWWWDGGLK
jgi:hypothetical protein